MFHSRNGLFFQATGQGNVCIIKTSDGKEPYSRSFPDSDKVETNIVCDVTLPENEWASVVCSVSAGGEDHARWMRARRFHGTELPFSEHELKGAVQEELTQEQREWMNAPLGPVEEWTPTPAQIATHRASDHCEGVITPESDEQVIARLRSERRTGKKTFAWQTTSGADL